MKKMKAFAVLATLALTVSGFTLNGYAQDPDEVMVEDESVEVSSPMVEEDAIDATEPASVEDDFEEYSEEEY